MIDPITVVLVTHTDLDGAGCAVLFKKYFSDFPVLINLVIFYENYDTVDARIVEVMRELTPATLFITDITPQMQSTKDLLQEYAQSHHVRILDHHPAKDDSLTRYPWVTIDQSACGTMLTWKELYHMFKEEDEESKSLRLFAEIVDDYDRGINALTASSEFNLMKSFLGTEAFVDRCMCTSTPGELRRSESETIYSYKKFVQRHIEEDVKRAEIQTLQGKKVAVMYSTQSPTEISWYLKEQKWDVDFLVVINMSIKAVSLRTIAGGTNLTEISRLFHGGGHPKAAGFTRPPRVFDDVTNLILGREY